MPSNWRRVRIGASQPCALLHPTHISPKAGTCPRLSIPTHIDGLRDSLRVGICRSASRDERLSPSVLGSNATRSRPQRLKLSCITYLLLMPSIPHRGRSATSSSRRKNSLLVSPDVVRAFRTPGVEDAGEIQEFISVHDVPRLGHRGDWRPLAVTRCLHISLGDEDQPARGRTFLHVDLTRRRRWGDRGSTATAAGRRALKNALLWTWEGERGSASVQKNIFRDFRPYPGGGHGRRLERCSGHDTGHGRRDGDSPGRDPLSRPQARPGRGSTTTF